MNIITCGIEDLDEIYEVERRSFSSPLSKSTIEGMLKNPSARFYAVKDCEIRAFVCFERVCGEGQIVSVAVHPDFRGRGLAGALLEEIKKEDVMLYTLEVRSDNLPAISLYKKHGFKAVGMRKGYYENPACDAILMDLCLKEG